MSRSRVRREASVRRLSYRSRLALELLLKETVLFVLKAGLDSTLLARILRDQARRAGKEKALRMHRRTTAVHSWYQDVAECAASVVADWHRGSKYADSSGEPLPLSEAAVHKLISERCGSKNCEKTFLLLRANRIIQCTRDGLFVLRSGNRAALFSAREQVLSRAAVIVPEILAAALRNSRVVSSDLREVNRTMRVRHLPWKYLPLWRQLMRERTEAFLEGLDNWLEDHNEPNSAEPTVSVGLHVCGCSGRSSKRTSSRMAKRRVSQARGNGSLVWKKKAETLKLDARDGPRPPEELQ